MLGVSTYILGGAAAVGAVIIGLWQSYAPAAIYFMALGALAIGVWTANGLRWKTGKRDAVASTAARAINKSISQPKIVLGELFIDDQIDYYRAKHLRVAFATFSNQPTVRVAQNSAKGVRATLRFYKSDRTALLSDRPNTGLWTSNPPQRTLYIDSETGEPTGNWDATTNVNLSYNGEPELLYLASRDENDRFSYIVDTGHFTRRRTDRKLLEKEIHVQIQLTGEHVDEAHWVVLTNTGKTFSVKQP